MKLIYIANHFALVYCFIAAYMFIECLCCKMTELIQTHKKCNRFASQQESPDTGLKDGLQKQEKKDEEEEEEAEQTEFTLHTQCANIKCYEGDFPATHATSTPRATSNGNIS